MTMSGLHIVVIGGGNIGQAVAWQSIEKGAKVTLFDRDQDRRELIRKEGHSFIQNGTLTVPDSESIFAELNRLAAFHCVILATSWQDGRHLLKQLAEQYNVPILMLGRPDINDPLITEIELQSTNSPILMGTGLEPGLIEGFAASMVSQVPKINSLITYCGGLPQHPSGIFGYKQVFGRRLPIDPRISLSIRDGAVLSTPRFSQVEHVYFEHIGLLEAFDDAMMATTASIFSQQVDHFSQRTLRWPGFARAAQACTQLGLLSDDCVTISEEKLPIRDIAEKLLTRTDTKTTVETKLDNDFVLCRWVVEDSDGQHGSLTLHIAAPATSTAMAYTTAAFAIAAAVTVLSEPQSGLIYPHHPVMQTCALNFLRGLRHGSNAIIVTTGILEEMLKGELDDKGY
ncbi:Lysine 6-dehydrogenase [Xenorhabdus mauleonii]|uniref:Lysine 6-dehydrogenase n=1 Tax=Xenorhabdus mauleonii TaxID=351675 RepID=A0A1I3KL96_9GAMM|nr:saccharopine dehydrogenase C-terminal domain-containing protein [Xenorhabdus mauleonii]PHM45084.1 Lysine 6-dehydrogenase [Xenorhabdus mauleonii]SFI73154.1 Saccharopine dehydrogenase, NADP-dependent [Xenorhabdus mauleonii]